MFKLFYKLASQSPSLESHLCCKLLPLFLPFPLNSEPKTRKEVLKLDFVSPFSPHQTLCQALSFRHLISSHHPWTLHGNLKHFPHQNQVRLRQLCSSEENVLNVNHQLEARIGKYFQVILPEDLHYSTRRNTICFFRCFNTCCHFRIGNFDDFPKFCRKYT